MLSVSLETYAYPGHTRRHHHNTFCSSKESSFGFEDAAMMPSTTSANDLFPGSCGQGTRMPDSSVVLCRTSLRGYRQWFLIDAWPEPLLVSYTTNLRHGMPPQQLGWKGSTETWRSFHFDVIYCDRNCRISITHTFIHQCE